MSDEQGRRMISIEEPVATEATNGAAGVSRRKFVGGLAAAGVLATWTAKSYAGVVGSN